MKRLFFSVILVVVITLPLAIVGCKGKVEKPQEEQVLESPEMAPAPAATQGRAGTEPAQQVATDTIPPTASPEIAPKTAAPAPILKESRNKDVQKALKNAGFYTGTVDGKIGPKTKKAIVDFQKAKGLKSDGKVGPRTWIELEKYLTPQQ